MRNAIESERFHSTQPLRASVVDPYIEFIRQTLDQHPRLRATRIYQMIRDRGYSGSVVQLRRAVARSASAASANHSCDCRRFPASKRKSTGRTSAT